MIHVRCIYSTALAADRQRVEQVAAIYRQNFGDTASYADKITAMFERPPAGDERPVLLVCETGLGVVRGFSLVIHYPKINSTLLDFLAVGPGVKGGGVGSLLYEATREYAQQIGSRGLYLEVLSDEPALNPDPTQREDNRRRMRFYERFGVRPIVGTAYEEPVGEGNDPPPSLLFDGLGRVEPLGRGEARAAVRLILQSKYAHLVSPDYIERVVESFIDDPVRFRPPRYVRKSAPARPVATGKLEKAMALVVTEKHEVHHVHERGYVERPARVGALREALEAGGRFVIVPPRHFGQAPILAVHDRDFVHYLRRVCRTLTSRRPVYPYVFPIRRPDRRPHDLAVQAGYYCIDTFTPLDNNAYTAARAAVDAVLTAAEEILAGRPVAYALCRPPGHHAERRAFGGFCYFNNAAVATQHLSGEGPVAVLDIDYHHGNGTQDIFYQRSDVLTVSIHGHPGSAYPYFSGFADETGEGPGQGHNRNFPLAEGASPEEYHQAAEKAFRLIDRFGPAFVVVSVGFDTMRGDPTGSFRLSAGDLRRIGRQLAGLGRPLLVVQEGGYSLPNLRKGAVSFFAGIAEALPVKSG